MILLILCLSLNQGRCTVVNHFQQKTESLKKRVNQTEEIKRADIYNQIAEIETQHKTAEKENKSLELNQNLVSHKRIQLLMFILIGLLAALLVALFVILKIRNESLKKSRTLQKQEKELNEIRLQQVEDDKLQSEQKVFAEQQINKLIDEKHKNELEYKNTELSHLTATIIDKNSVLIKAKDILKKDRKLLNENNKVKNLYTYILSNIDSYQNWYLFKQSFEKTDPGFFDRLMTHYPELTENDHKLCAYLKMKLTTKEIANLLNISEVSISKRRNRLRKKLNLPPEYDLYEWLKTI